MTVAIDPFGSVDNDLLEQTAEYIDLVEIGMSAPILVERSKLQKRIGRYHELGINVLAGGTLLQVAAEKDVIPQVLQRIRSVGFDAVVISEPSRIPTQKKEQILEWIARNSLDYFFEVGLGGAPSTAQISSIREAFGLKSRKVVIDLATNVASRLSSSEPIEWELVNEVVGQFGPPSLIFRTPEASQRTALILEFGPGVNLIGVPVDDVHYLEMQRLGFATETLGLSRPVQNVEGSPAVKFVYHLIRIEHPVDQTTLTLRSGLPKRTVQEALRFLVAKGFVRAVSEASDMRRHKYTLG